MPIPHEITWLVFWFSLLVLLSVWVAFQVPKFFSLTSSKTSLLVSIGTGGATLFIINAIHAFSQFKTRHSFFNQDTPSALAYAFQPPIAQLIAALLLGLFIHRLRLKT